ARLRQTNRRRHASRGAQQPRSETRLARRQQLRTTQMGFFIETVIGGLMSGMLYALVALGFVLIFKASGVFNFAQGAMLLVAALAMARLSEWIPQWLGMERILLGNVLAFVVCGGLMW